ncbi:putative addiction module component, TIGR02574 family [Opitutaceae bacterium TAV1]|nr:addiction module antitoxin RelB [Opitutaceae bacterium TAV5]EIQ01175.1 putative addiction module component, TIGR02574 family [Opitutaceae bacterium TAV1]
MPSQIAISELTTEEKLSLMEELWQDISRDPANVPSPEWHRELLARREQDLAEGRDSFLSWEDAKKQLRARHL